MKNTAQINLQWLGDNDDGWYLRRHNADGTTNLLAIVTRDHYKGGFIGSIGTENRDENRLAGKSAKALRVQIYNRLAAPATAAAARQQDTATILTLRAAAPIRGHNTADVDGLGLFDRVRSPYML